MALFNSPNFKSVVNNAALDPLQGFDADVWVLDQGTGSYNLVGRFTSIQVTIRNATEPYLEYNQRIPRQLDGDIQIGWMMERGQLDGRVIEQTFGISSLNRQLRLSRMPRFQITFHINAPELESGNSTSTGNPNGGVVTDLVSPPSGTGGGQSSFSPRRARGIELVLSMCKIDSFTIGSSAGKTVIANRWEGLAEGIDTLDRGNDVGAGAGLFFSSDNSDAVRERFDQQIAPYPWDPALGDQVLSSIIQT